MIPHNNTTYRLVLRNEKTAFYRSFAVFLFILNFVSIGLSLYSADQAPAKRYLELATSLWLIGHGGYLIFKGQHRWLFPGLMILFAGFWISLHHWMLASTDIFLVLLYLYSVRVPIVELSGASVRYPSFPPRKFEWSQIANLVLKDGLLTIDFRNNRLVQQLLVRSAETQPTEAEINEFCRARIESAQG